MMYRIPMPTKANGVRLHTLPNDQIGVEYTKGTEPHVGPMAYDSSCGIMTRNITFRRSRPDYAAIVADAVRTVDAMPKAGKPPIGNSDMKNDDNLQYDDDATEVLSKLMDFLQDKLGPDEMDVVTQILSSGETDGDRIGEKREPAGEDRRGRRQAADSARRRPMSDAAEASYLKMFPLANRLA